MIINKKSYKQNIKINSFYIIFIFNIELVSYYTFKTS